MYFLSRNHDSSNVTPDSNGEVAGVVSVSSYMHDSHVGGLFRAIQCAIQVLIGRRVGAYWEVSRHHGVADAGAINLLRAEFRHVLGESAGWRERQGPFTPLLWFRLCRVRNSLSTLRAGTVLRSGPTCIDN
jgi:hypothetical protein